MSKRGAVYVVVIPLPLRKGERESVCVDERGNARRGVGIPSQSVLGPRGSNGTVASS